MKNCNDTIGDRTRDLPTCSAVPQPIALPRTPVLIFVLVQNLFMAWITKASPILPFWVWYERSSFIKPIFFVKKPKSYETIYRYRNVEVWSGNYHTLITAIKVNG